MNKSLKILECSSMLAGSSKTGADFHYIIPAHFLHNSYTINNENTHVLKTCGNTVFAHFHCLRIILSIWLSVFSRIASASEHCALTLETIKP